MAAKPISLDSKMFFFPSLESKMKMAYENTYSELRSQFAATGLVARRRRYRFCLRKVVSRFSITPFAVFCTHKTGRSIAVFLRGINGFLAATMNAKTSHIDMR